MDIISSHAILKLFSTLCLVVSFIFVIAYLLKRFGFNRYFNPSKDQSRCQLYIKETKMLDVKRRLVVVAWGGEEHLILLGQQGETLIKSLAIAPGSSALAALQPSRLSEKPHAYEKCS